MNHLAIIQSEFIKEACKWKDMSLEFQKAYLKRHPKSKRQIDVGKRIVVENKKKNFEDYDFAKDAVNEIDNQVDDIIRHDYTDKDSIEHYTEKIFDSIAGDVSDEEAEYFEQKQDKIRNFIKAQLKKKIKEKFKKDYFLVKLDLRKKNKT